MDNHTKIPNRLINEKSPYLLQHAYNPVDWWPWCDEAFAKAKAEDKPVFLSIGYSTCHWCHVMERESFENKEIAELLNAHFISIKVDRELRPDIDSIYMSVCQAMTGGGGWPLSIFMTPAQKPFFAGTYFPPRAAFGQAGFQELLTVIGTKWQQDRETLLDSAEEIIKLLQNEEKAGRTTGSDLIKEAVAMYQYSFDDRYGGFGKAPKFPTAHNFLFLLSYFEVSNDFSVLKMAEKTLTQMYKGGLFDHIGGGFARYSTDARFLVPHFEKMLYDNALLMMAYAQAYRITGKEIYGLVAERTAAYILREMTHKEGGFYSARDADSEGEEGKFYTFSDTEILQVLGQENGEKYNRFYDITPGGNFEGRNSPNLLQHEKEEEAEEFAAANRKLYEYRSQRMTLHLDDKILTAWNGLMIGSLAIMYQVFGNEEYLQAAMKAADFIERKMTKDNTLYVGYRDGERMVKGFLDDYAYYIFALIRLYDATLKKQFLVRAEALLSKVFAEFADVEKGGFFLNGSGNERLIYQPKETFDGALPSGNSVMAYNLVRLSQLCVNAEIRKETEKQIRFMTGKAIEYPMGNGFFLIALLDETYPPEHVVCVVKDQNDTEEWVKSARLTQKTPLHANVIMLEQPTGEYPLMNNRTTYYVCRNFSCLPPINEYPV